MLTLIMQSYDVLMLCYVEFIYRRYSLQFCNHSTIANQNRTKL